ncbi:RNA polymerase sigma factor [Amycolatopsis sp. Hca4]|uniref:RNA polymerase sigma factor n=1 Tax=Amycolatopsis sp. Hca4 TaxID=2742131 RepID=UPI00159286A1|nr:sigma-70 family RNA polymerase sigma factor [Amycolatopsis sp. Hca4]
MSITGRAGDQAATVVPIQRTTAADLTGPIAEDLEDAELIAAVRAGQLTAYGVLYSRHRGAAHSLARRLAHSVVEADDLVSEAFAKVLSALRGDHGPESAFRAYLLTALRHIAYNKARRARRLHLTENVEATAIEAAGPEKIAEPFRDTAIARLEHSMAAQAFARLPARWQEVLWHAEIEGLTPAEVAPLMGLSPNSVSALAYRARDGLRQEYLQAYLAKPDDQPQSCRVIAGKFGAWARDKLSKCKAAQVNAHLDDCSACRTVVSELHHELPARTDVRQLGKLGYPPAPTDRQAKDRLPADPETWSGGGVDSPGSPRTRT